MEFINKPIFVGASLLAKAIREHARSYKKRKVWSRTLYPKLWVIIRPPQ